MAPSISTNVEEPGAARCHWSNSGAGEPVAATSSFTVSASLPVMAVKSLVNASVASPGSA